MAWVLTLLFLRLNGHEMIADDFRAICVMVETASSSTSHEEISSAFARWMRPLQQAAV
jgi:prophage maintenance system killer protein